MSWIIHMCLLAGILATIIKIELRTGKKLGSINWYGNYGLEGGRRKKVTVMTIVMFCTCRVERSWKWININARRTSNKLKKNTFIAKKSKGDRIWKKF